MAACYRKLGRHEEALAFKRDIYVRTCRLHGDRSENAFSNAIALVNSLWDAGRYDEALSLLRERAPAARDALGPDHRWTLWLARQLAKALANRGNEGDVTAARTIIEDNLRRTRRVFGKSHPHTKEADLTMRRICNLPK